MTDEQYFHLIATLKLIADRLGPQKEEVLGFQDVVGRTYVYVNRTQGGLWYTLDNDRNPVNIPQNSLVGYIKKLEFKQVERRGKETWKLHLWVQADKLYVIETGHDSVAAKSIIASLAAATPEEIRGKVTLRVKAADQADEVVFCSLYSEKGPIMSVQDDPREWRDICKQAIDNIAAVVGNES